MNEKESLVCIIDDDSSIRESLADLLTSAGQKRKDIFLGTRVFDQRTTRDAQLPCARCADARNERA
jgi:FixJ family two-component response regulator